MSDYQKAPCRTEGYYAVVYEKGVTPTNVFNLDLQSRCLGFRGYCATVYGKRFQRLQTNIICAEVLGQQKAATPPSLDEWQQRRRLQLCGSCANANVCRRGQQRHHQHDEGTSAMDEQGCADVFGHDGKANIRGRATTLRRNIHDERQ